MGEHSELHFAFPLTFFSVFIRSIVTRKKKTKKNHTTISRFDCLRQWCETKGREVRVIGWFDVNTCGAQRIYNTPILKMRTLETTIDSTNIGRTHILTLYHWWITKISPCLQQRISAFIIFPWEVSWRMKCFAKEHETFTQPAGVCFSKIPVS